jgi:hypothetical protein
MHSIFSHLVLLEGHHQQRSYIEKGDRINNSHSNSLCTLKRINSYKIRITCVSEAQSMCHIWHVSHVQCPKRNQHFINRNITTKWRILTVHNLSLKSDMEPARSYYYSFHFMRLLKSKPALSFSNHLTVNCGPKICATRGRISGKWGKNVFIPRLKNGGQHKRT